MFHSPFSLLSGLLFIFSIYIYITPYNYGIYFNSYLNIILIFRNVKKLKLINSTATDRLINNNNNILN